MKSQIRNFVISAGFAALLSTPILTAQTRLAVAEVPFDFTVGASSLPAGNYTVSSLGNLAGIVLRNDDTHKSIILASIARGDDKDKAVLAFRCYGDRCFLSEVDVPWSPAYIMTKGRLELEASKTDTRATMAFVTMERR